MPLPDEGVIHAWLDGQLPPDEAVRIEQLVETDPEWATAAAEARGLIAASSRILSALDQVPAGVVPKRTTLPAVRRLPWWTKAAAAVVLVVGASVVVLERVPSPVVANAPTARDVSPTAKTPPTASAVSPLAPPVANTAAPAAGKDHPASSKPGTVRAARREEKTSIPEAQLATTGAAVADARPPAEPARATSDLAPPVAMQSAQQMQTMQQGRADATQQARDAQRQKVANVIGACHRLRDSRTSAEVGTVMRVVRIEGDTLRLEPAHTPSPLRAWVVWGNGTPRGVLTTEPDGRGMVLVTATPVACPAP